MITLVVHHRVRDYGMWKAAFDEHGTVRASHGEVEHRIYRMRSDGNVVVVHNDFPSVDERRASRPIRRFRKPWRGPAWKARPERACSS